VHRTSIYESKITTFRTILIFFIKFEVTNSNLCQCEWSTREFGSSTLCRDAT